MTNRTEFLELVDPETARDTIAGFDLAAGSEPVALADASSRVLADRIDASIDVPGFDRASMDGYAVRAADTVGASEASPVSLDLCGAVHAGEEPDASVTAGTAVEVSTGAVLPSGADAVVKVERTTRRDDAVAIQDAVPPGANVMPAGDDVAAGDRALGSGTVLTSREVGLLAALGRQHVPVRSRPRVAVVSTGAELVGPDATPDGAAGEIYDVNGPAIATAVQDAGGEPVAARRVPDDVEALRRTLVEYAETCDLVLTSGSTSAGAVDVLADVVADLGTIEHHGIAIKPGKPTLIGRVADTPYVGLPGYPVSAMSVFRSLLAPALRRAADRPPMESAAVTATLSTRVEYAEGRHRLLPVGLVRDAAGEALAYPVDKGSGATTSLANADGIVEMPADRVRLDAGASVEIQCFGSDGRPPRLFGVGEGDPMLWRVLDRVDRTRFLPVGSDEGARRLETGVPDVAVVTGEWPSGDRSPEDALGERLGGWTREWGLGTAGEAAPVDLAEVVDSDVRVAVHAMSGLRSAFESALADLANHRSADDSAMADRVDTDATYRGHAGPLRAVADEDPDVGVGLRSTATDLGLDFHSLGHQPVHVLANPDRVEKAGVRALEAALGDEIADTEAGAGLTWRP